MECHALFLPPSLLLLFACFCYRYVCARKRSTRFVHPLSRSRDRIRRRRHPIDSIPVPTPSTDQFSQVSSSAGITLISQKKRETSEFCCQICKSLLRRETQRHSTMQGSSLSSWHSLHQALSPRKRVRNGSHRPKLTFRT